MDTHGQPFAGGPKTIPSSLIPSPQGVLLVERTNSIAETSERKRWKPCAKRIERSRIRIVDLLYPCMPQIQLSRPYCMLLGPPWVSPIIHPEKSTCFSSARSSPFVSLRKSVSVAL